MKDENKDVVKIETGDYTFITNSIQKPDGYALFLTETRLKPKNTKRKR